MSRPPSPTGNRSVVFAGAPYTFPDPVGDTRILYDNDALEWIEEALEPELDKLNARVAAGNGPRDDKGTRVRFELDSVFDALGHLSSRRMAQTTNVLVVAGLAHRYDGDVSTRTAAARADVGSWPPALWQEEELASAIQRALATAFGQDVDTPTAAPPAAPLPPPMADAAGASASDGTISSPSGPPPLTQAG